MTATWLKKGLAPLMAAAALAIAAPVLAEEFAPKLNVGGVSTGGGSVKGTVKFNGKQATRQLIRMDTDKACVAAHKEPVRSETWVFGDNSTLQNVFVYVSKGAPTGAKPEAKPELDQIGCVYVPHVSGMVAGQELLINNGDKTLHNVKFSSPANGAFNESTPEGTKITKKFSKPEVAKQEAAPFQCSVHPWMSAYVHVMEHPFFAVTQQDGTFEIKGLPDGEYELTAWQEFKKFGPDQPAYKVTVKDGKAGDVVITYAPLKAAAAAQ